LEESIFDSRVRIPHNTPKPRREGMEERRAV
jgi:hypothetical protein